jgi:hypothetical protein
MAQLGLESYSSISSPKKDSFFPPYKNFHAILYVKWNTIAKTTPWTSAFIFKEPPLGSDNKTPGVRIKNKKATNMLM